VGQPSCTVKKSPIGLGFASKLKPRFVYKRSVNEVVRMELHPARIVVDEQVRLPLGVDCAVLKSTQIKDIK